LFVKVTWLEFLIIKADEAEIAPAPVNRIPGCGKGLVVGALCCSRLITALLDMFAGATVSLNELAANFSGVVAPLD
jgi:hypothetical protein